MMKKFTMSLTILFLFLTLTHEAFSGSTAFSAHEFLKKSNDNKLKNSMLSTSPVFYLDANSLEREINPAKQITINDFPVSASRSATLELKRVTSVVDQRTLFVTQTPGGEFIVTGPSVQTFSGSIMGRPDSKVYLVYVRGSLFGSIQDGPDNYFISPNLKDNDGTAHTIVNNAEFTAAFPLDFKCLVGDKQAVESFGSKTYTPPRLLSNKLLEVELAVETDTPFFLATGGTLEKVQNYTVALYSLVSALYEEQTRITIHLSWVKNWTDAVPDPYDVEGNPYVLAPKAATYWGDHYSDVHRDLAQVVTADPVGQGGWSLFNSLCNFDSKTEVGMSFLSITGTRDLPTYAFTYDVYMTAHELGHNFNAEHTHSCFWNPPIDTCLVADGIAAGCFKDGQKVLPNPGSIMSYCPGANYQYYGKYECRLIFLPQIEQVIRQSAEAATCVLEPPDPYINLFSPHGEESFLAEDDILIKWTSTQVSIIKIEYTNDKGKTWNEINGSVSALQGQYQWKAPLTCGNYKIRISDALDTKVSDTCLKTFQVTRNSQDALVTYYPFNNDTKDAVCNFHDADTVGAGAKPAKDMNNRDNSAYQLDGNSFIKSKDFNMEFQNISLSCFFYIDALTGGAGAINFLAGQNWAQNGSFQLAISSNYVGMAVWLPSSNIPSLAWSTSPVQQKKWNHAVVTVNKNEAKLYINGKFDKSIALTDTLKHNISPLYIGSRNGEEFFNGRIDEVRIYKKVLSDYEITRLYKDLQKPASTSLLLPADGAIDQDTTLALSWDVSELADVYNIQVSKSSAFASKDLVIDRKSYKGTSIDISGLGYDTKYYWRVAASNKNGVSDWSEVYSLTTKILVSVNDNVIVNEMNSNIYPNPVGEKAEIRFDAGLYGDVRVQLYNSMGKRADVDFSVLGGRIVFDTSLLPAGSYYYKLQSGKRTDLRKFVIVR